MIEVNQLGHLGMNNKTIEQRFFNYVLICPEHSCWEWIGAKSGSGYGVFWANNKNWRAHRMSLIIHGIEIKSDEVVDHTCRNIGCVNPKHLRSVTQRVNVLENNSSPASLNAKKTHCKHGHEFNESNTGPHQLGGRFCRICSRLASKAWRIKTGYKSSSRNK